MPVDGALAVYGQANCDRRGLKTQATARDDTGVLVVMVIN
jgi:hypothetical protein|tara:strand:+ start:1183 stop:1302 length:120 start_codon:yes stop_codon:yes gene_type:complete